MSYPVKFDVEYPEKSSRGVLLLKVFFGWLYVGIPHGFLLFFMSIAVSVIQFIVFWAILFTGKYPKSMFDFVVSYQRWVNNLQAYMYFQRDEYPPFNGNA
jgi:hypothetical protein